MNTFDENEFLDICKKFGEIPRVEEAVIMCKRGGYFRKVEEAVREDRRGEVVFGVLRPGGRMITVTCAEYPEGIFRVPTGGIGYGENIIDAVYRETKEELGLEVEIARFAGVLKIKFQYENEEVMFFSYLFLLKEKGGRLLLDASDDEVSEVMEVDVEGLKRVVEKLGSIEGNWSDWGRFRQASSGAVLRVLERCLPGN